MFAVLSVAVCPSVTSAVDLDKTLDELLPSIGAIKIEDTADAQLQWERTCRDLCVPGKETERVAASRLMAEKLGSDITSVAKIWLLRQLDFLGGEECVEAVAAAMNDEDLLVQQAARRTLTSNASPIAGAMLAVQLEKETDDNFKIGLLNGLGFRGDAVGVDAAIKSLNDRNKKVVAAAADALGKIGTLDAAEALQARRLKSEGELRDLLGNASLRCAKTMMRKGMKIDAQSIYGELSSSKQSSRVETAALYGVLTTMDDGKGDLIRGILIDNNASLPAAAAAHIVELDAAAAKKVAESLVAFSAENQVLALQALALRADKAVLADVLPLVKSDNAQVRIAALRALSTLGDASVLPLLLEGLDEGGVTASAARRSLETMYGEGVDGLIIKAMQAAESTGRRAMLIEVLQRRRSAGSVVVLMDEIDHEDPEVRRRAMAALSQLAEIEDVPKMTAGVLFADRGGERDEAEKSIMLLCRRVGEKDAQAAPVLGVYGKASADDQRALLPLLGRIGGAGALEQVEAALASDDSKLYSVGVRALSNWPDGDVAEQLLELFQSSENSRHKLQAMRAFIRVIALRHPRSSEESLTLLKQAMELCERDKERNLILSRTVSAEIRSIEALRFILPYLENPATAQMACRAIVALSHHRYLRRPNEAEFSKALGLVIETSEDPNLIDQARRYRSDL